jgi:hypothetical protein
LPKVCDFFFITSPNKDFTTYRHDKPEEVQIVFRVLRGILGVLSNISYSKYFDAAQLKFIKRVALYLNA